MRYACHGDYPLFTTVRKKPWAGRGPTYSGVPLRVVFAAPNFDLEMRIVRAALLVSGALLSNPVSGQTCPNQRANRAAEFRL